MLILPAIDIKDNKCVRLSQGDFNRMEIYYHDPLQAAYRWRNEGAQYLHLVDLDGARQAIFVNDESIRKIVTNIDIPLQLGGGIREEGRVKMLLESGVDRVILATAALENRKLLDKLVGQYGSDKILVSVDALDGLVAARGWQKVSTVKALDFCRELEEDGIETIIYTDIRKDGMLAGPNLRAYKDLQEKTGLQIIAAGGIRSKEDLIGLRELDLYGAIIGKALYDGLLLMEEVQKWLR